MPESEPQYIGRYRAHRIVGSGAFATVWLSEDETLNVPVAIKVLAENWAHDEEVRRRFIEEARILWNANSDHIVRIHNVDTLADGRPYFVMDFADRGTLHERMGDGLALLHGCTAQLVFATLVGVGDTPWAAVEQAARKLTPPRPEQH